jgi:hypothetical protein
MRNDDFLFSFFVEISIFFNVNISSFLFCFQRVYLNFVETELEMYMN